MTKYWCIFRNAHSEWMEILQADNMATAWHLAENYASRINAKLVEVSIAQ